MNLTRSELPASRGVWVFFVIWLAQLVSLIGTRLTAFALGVWVYQKTGSATQFALIAFFTALPGLALLPLTGALVDRWDRRKVMMLGDAGAGLCTLIIALLTAADHLHIWHIYALMVVSSACEAFQWPAYTAATTLLIPKEHYGRAAGMLPLARSISQTLAPFAGGFLLLSLGLSSVLLIDVLTCCFAIGSMALIRIPMPPQSQEGQAGQGSLWRESAYGWRYIMARPGLLALLLYFTAHNLMVATVRVLAVPLVLSFSTVEVLGTVLAISSMGVFVGSIIASSWGGPKSKIAGIFAAGLCRGVCLIAAGWYPSAMLFTVTYGLSLVTLPIMNGCSQAIWQRKVAPDVQGRVFAFRKLIAFSSIPLAHFFAGPLADYVFEPGLLEGGRFADSLGQFIGTGPGRGIGLIFIIAGLLVIGNVIVSGFAQRLRRVEDEIPDSDGVA